MTSEELDYAQGVEDSLVPPVHLRRLGSLRSNYCGKFEMGVRTTPKISEATCRACRKAWAKQNPPLVFCGK